MGDAAGVDRHDPETGDVSMDTVATAKELTKVVKQIEKVEAILVQLRLRRAELLRELGGA